MSAVMIGGMDRLHRDYIETAKSLGIDLKIFSGQERSIRKALGSADVVILCMGKLSHSARIETRKCADSRKIPVQMIHSAGVSSLRICLERCIRAN
jgi:cellobiose-specific phosphotransferase system component IIB